MRASMLTAANERTNQRIHDLLQIDEGLYDQIAGGSGGNCGCCQNPTITTEELPGGGTRHTVDCN